MKHFKQLRIYDQGALNLSIHDTITPKNEIVHAFHCLVTVSIFDLNIIN